MQGSKTIHGWETGHSIEGGAPLRRSAGCSRSQFRYRSPTPGFVAEKRSELHSSSGLAQPMPLVGAWVHLLPQVTEHQPHDGQRVPAICSKSGAFGSPNTPRFELSGSAGGTEPPKACRGRGHLSKVHGMKNPFFLILLAALALSACDKAADDSESRNSPTPDSRIAEARTSVRTGAGDRQEPVTHAGGPTTPHERSVPPESPLAVPSSPSDGLEGLPQEVADQILAEAARASSPDEQTRIITEQSDAWRRVDQFRRQSQGVSDHRKLELLEAMGNKHGTAWDDMVAELDAEVRAYEKVMEYRSSGIPGHTAEESFAIIMEALEKHAPDYGKILTIVGERAEKE